MMEPLLPHKLPRARNTLFVRRIQPLERLEGVILSPQMWGLITHWTGKFTKPCCENTELCVGGHREDNQRWAGFLQFLPAGGGRQVFVTMPPETAGELFQVAPPGLPLRGLYCVWVKGKGKTSPLHVEYQPHKNIDGKLLPRSIDPYPSLARFYGIVHGGPFRISLMANPGDSTRLP